MKLRRVTEADRATIEKWTENDPAHKGTPFEFYSVPHTESWIIEDAAGPVFAFRLDSAVIRLFIQFDREQDRSSRVARALKFGFGQLMQAARKKERSQLIFESSSPELVKFCEKRFGFEASPNEYVLRLR